mmetsp:Transcript_61624/g.182087  ORF Transcript_61624/g.182087 Transcript_61624/m.182087 type:complete len:454 (-) Transcript_61624:17-1378(-)
MKTSRFRSAIPRAAAVLLFFFGAATSSPRMLSRAVQVKPYRRVVCGAAAFTPLPTTPSLGAVRRRFVLSSPFLGLSHNVVLSPSTRPLNGGSSRWKSRGSSPEENARDRSPPEDIEGGAERAVRGGGFVGIDPAHPPAESSQSMLLAGAQVLPIVKGVGVAVAGCTAIALGMLYLNQEKLLYIPEIDGIPRNNCDNPPGYRSPAEYALPFEKNMIKAEDGVSIHSWLLLHPQSKERELPTIIFFHGNAGNIGIRLPNAQQMYELLNANVLLVEYRGYGDSDDVKPNERGLKLDAESALRFAFSHPSIDSSRIFIFGRSLGGAIGFHAAQYAEENGLGPLAGLIVENTFVSVDRMVDVLLPFLSPLKGFFLRMHYDCGKIAPTISVPILYLAGDADEIVPFEHMTELFVKSKKSSVLPKMHVVEGGTHNETWLQGGRNYWKQIQSFMSDALSIR